MWIVIRKETPHCVGQRNQVGQVRDEAHCGDKEWRNGAISWAWIVVGRNVLREQSKGWNRRNVQKLYCCSKYRECLGTLYETAARHGRRKKHLTPASALPPVHEKPTNDKPGSSRDSASSSSPTQAPSGIRQHANVRAQAQTISRSLQQTVVEANIPVVPTSTVLPTAIPKAQLRDGRVEHEGAWSRDIRN